MYVGDVWSVHKQDVNVEKSNNTFHLFRHIRVLCYARKRNDVGDGGSDLGMKSRDRERKREGWRASSNAKITSRGMNHVSLLERSNTFGSVDFMRPR